MLSISRVVGVSGYHHHQWEEGIPTGICDGGM
jgi:hypothetical protein